MDIINEYLKRTRKVVEIRFACTTQLFDDVRPYLKCKDGYTVSVQASGFHYCSPREDGADIYMRP